MTFLLDSNALLWATYAPEKLAPEVVRLLDDPANECLVSHASLWEPLAKIASRKLLVGDHSVDGAMQDINALGLRILPISVEHLVAAAKLPPIHFDPFDRMLIAQAMQTNAVIITSDGLLGRYGVKVLAI